MKVEITCDERYPVYSVDAARLGRPSVEVPRETVERWLDAERAFEAAQQEIKLTLEDSQ